MEYVKGNPGLMEVNVACVAFDKDTALKVSSPDLTAGSYVEVVVKDTGQGMDEKTLQLIFDPFFTTKQHGEGMGLSVVQGIVKAHQGTIGVWSSLGKGSTYKVFLPKLEKGCGDRK